MKQPKYDVERFREAFRKHLSNGGYQHWKIETLQVAIYVAAGGGMIGRMYAEQPKIAYRDIRCGPAPYKARDLENMRKTLCVMADGLGLEPDNLPKTPDFPSCNVF